MTTEVEAYREYHATVTSLADPERLLRVSVRVHGLMESVPDNKLPWATYKLPTGHSVNSGDFTPSKEGDLVWVDFPYFSHGIVDTRKPRITGSVHYAPEGVPNAPKEASGVAFEHKREGVDPFASKSGYHKPRIVTINDTSIEHAEDGTLRLFSRKSGSIVEINPDGKILIKAFGDLILKSEKNIHIKAKGNFEVTAKRIDLN